MEYDMAYEELSKKKEEREQVCKKTDMIFFFYIALFIRRLDKDKENKGNKE